MADENCDGCGASKLQQSYPEDAEAPLTLVSLPPDLLERVLGLDNPRNCMAAAQLNQPLRRAALEIMVRRATADASMLCAAAKAGNVAAVRALLQSGADPDALDRHGWRPASSAAAGGNVAVMDVLLAAGADVWQKGTNRQCHRPLEISVLDNNIAMVHFLLNNVAGMSTTLCSVPQKSRYAREGTEVDVTPLYLAAREGNVPVVKMLLEEHGADPNLACGRMQRTPLFAAAASGRKILAALLLEKGAEVDKPCCDTGATPLACAAYHSCTSVMRVLLKAGADPNGLDIDGNPLLCEIAAAKFAAVAEALLEAGAYPNPRNKRGQTPLHLAACGDDRYDDDTDLIRLLLCYGADINAIDDYGRTPLMHAVYVGCHGKLAADCSRLLSVRTLLEAGALVDEQKPAHEGGQTALHLAVERCAWDIRVVEALLDAGASRTLCDAEGNTPLDVAEARRHGALVWLLRRFNY